MIFPHSHCTEFLPYIQPVSTLFQFKIIATCCISKVSVKKFLSRFLISLVYVLESCCKVTLESSLFQAKQPYLSLSS